MLTYTDTSFLLKIALTYTSTTEVPKIALTCIQAIYSLNVNEWKRGIGVKRSTTHFRMENFHSKRSESMNH